MKINNINKEKISKILPYLIILISTLFICIPLCLKQLYMFRDDGIQHICRLMGTYQSIQEKQIIPLIMSNFCNGFGYSWNIFYSPITAYVPLIFKIFNTSFTGCIKLFMILVIYLSGVTMYTFVNKVTKNKYIAILASVFYILAPYRITDMYIRNALAELTSFIFIPMIFNGMYTMINENKRSNLLAIGTIGLILTHLIVTLYMAIICFIYVLINVKKIKNKEVIKNLVINLLFALLITSFFWVPLIQHKNATQYEVFVPGRMERTEVLEYYKLDFNQLIATPKDKTMVYSIGFVILVGLLLTPLAYSKIKNKNYKKLYIYSLTIGIILTIMTLKIFPFEKLPSTLKMIQFSFRLFEFTSFMFAFVAATNYIALIKKDRMYFTFVLIVISALLLIPYINKFEFKEYDENKLWPSVRLTEKTGRVHAGMASFEYLPSKAFNNKQYIINRNNEPIIEQGKAKITNYYKDNSNMTMELSNISNDTSIELPYIYYLGYNITINDGDNSNIINYSESDNGFIEIDIPQNIKNAIVTVNYTGTKTMRITIIISTIALLILLTNIFQITIIDGDAKIKIRKDK